MKVKNKIVVAAAIPATATVESESVDLIELEEEEGDDDDDVDVDVDVAVSLAIENMTAIVDGAGSSQVSLVGFLQSTMPLATLQQAHFCVVLLYTMSGA